MPNKVGHPHLTGHPLIQVHAEFDYDGRLCVVVIDKLPTPGHSAWRLSDLFSGRIYESGADLVPTMPFP